MHEYVAYGLEIRSAFELPELTPSDGTAADADVVVERASVDPVDPAVDDAEERRVDAGPSVCRITYDDVGTFRVADGERIEFDPVDADVTDARTFRRLLEGQVLGVVLHQRDTLVLHASAVVVDGEAVVFLGDRGAGKSTTAAACHERGFPLLDDDVVAIRFDDGVPTVAPGVPELKLRPDAADALGVEPGEDATEDAAARKCYRRTDERPDPVPIGSCYVLQSADAPRVDPVDPVDRLFVLVANTYTVGLLEETDGTPAHFEQCAAVVDAARVRALGRPDDLSALPDVVDLVAEDATATTVDPEARPTD